MKKLVVLFVFALIGCGPQVKTSSFQAPLQNSADFKDCVAAEVTNTNGVSITVVRCPNSSTTTTKFLDQGAKQVSVVVDQETI